jgi:4-amino-4-deoxy-L-arabinose transferase-like glycosyltransferase
MTRAHSLARTNARLPAAALLLVVIVLGFSVLFRRVDHDESQYVAAIGLMRSGLPYRDFAYFQTPLLPLLLSPLARLPAGCTFVAVRMASGLCGVVTILCLWRTLEHRVSFRSRMIALASLLCTNAFLLASALARNDALAMTLLAAALLPLLRAIEVNSRLQFALAGLLFGLAISAKISAALPAAGAGLFILKRSPSAGLKTVIAFALGLVAGLMPTLVSAAFAPGAFWFDVFTYNLQAPVQWWSSIGDAGELSPLVRIAKLVAMATLGPVLVALAASAVDRRADEERLILDFMVIGGIFAAFLPVPALTQYLVPLLPPLFARFAFALDNVGGRRRLILLSLAGLTSVAGLTSSVIASSAKLEAARNVRVGQNVAALAKGGPVVTLSPQYVAGEGVNLDARFAAGPFLYRIRGKLALKAESLGRAVAVESLSRSLAQHPPAVILVGGERESFPPTYPNGLDQPLVIWSERRGYRREPLSGGFIAFVNPNPSGFHAH